MTTRRPLLSTPEVSEYLGVSMHTLQDWACKGTGPRFAKVGRHRRYRWDDIERWLDAHSVHDRR